MGGPDDAVCYDLGGISPCALRVSPSAGILPKFLINTVPPLGEGSHSLPLFFSLYKEPFLP